VVASALNSTPARGLDTPEAQNRLRSHGPNRLREVRPRSAWLIAAAQFRGLIVALLAAAAVVSLAFGEPIEAAAIAAVIVLNAAIGFATELGAVRSMEALRGLGAVSATVRRDGRAQTIAAVDVVPGDILLLDGGDLISADARVLEASKLETDE